MDSNHHIVNTKLIYSQRPFPNWIPTLIMADGGGFEPPEPFKVRVFSKDLH